MVEENSIRSLAPNRSLRSPLDSGSQKSMDFSPSEQWQQRQDLLARGARRERRGRRRQRQLLPQRCRRRPWAVEAQGVAAPASTRGMGALPSQK